MQKDSFEYRSSKKALYTMAYDNEPELKELFNSRAEKFIEQIDNIPAERLWEGSYPRSENMVMAEAILSLMEDDEIGEQVYNDVCNSVKEVMRKYKKELFASTDIDDEIHKKVTPYYFIMRRMLPEINQYTNMLCGTNVQEMAAQDSAYSRYPDSPEEWGDFLGEEWFGLKPGEFKEHPMFKKNVKRFLERLLNEIYDKAVFADEEELEADSVMYFYHTVCNCCRTLNGATATFTGTAINSLTMFDDSAYEFPRIEMARNGIYICQDDILDLANMKKTPDGENVQHFDISGYLFKFGESVITELYRNYVRREGRNCVEGEIKDFSKAVKEDGFLSNLDTPSRTVFSMNCINKEVRNMDIAPYVASLMWGCGLYMYKKMNSHAITEYYKAKFTKKFKTDIEKRKSDERSKYVDGLIQKINEQNKKLQEMEQKNAKLSAELKTLKESADRTEKEIALEDEVRVLSKKADRLEQQYNETELKLQEEQEERHILEEKMDYIKSMKNNSIESKIDFNAKYVFISAHENMNAKLRMWFPNSVNAMDYEITDANCTSIKAVVCITVESNHPQYYKAKNACIKKGVPFINCNSVNMDKIADAIARGIAEMSGGNGDAA